MSQYLESILRSLVVLKEMLLDRGIAPDALSHLSEEEVRVLANNAPIFHIRILEDMEVVYFMPKFNLRDMREHLTDAAMKRVIVISREIPQPGTVQTIAKENDDKDIQFFSIKQLQYNISRHHLVPKHELIKDPAEIQRILQAFQVKSRLQMPIILRTDPMARYLDAKPGQLFRITRPSPSAAEYVSYRCCV
jgi:DNA-directed RNA polymerase subunit H (RpoH/RPB5)